MVAVDIVKNITKLRDIILKVLSYQISDMFRETTVFVQ